MSETKKNHEIQLMLVPQPGAKPEFLATLRVVDPSPVVKSMWNTELPTEIRLHEYTRDDWALRSSSSSSSAMHTLVVESVDGRNKLPGFLSYLQQRGKVSYGRFQSAGIWMIVPQQPVHKKYSNRMECRIALNVTKVPNCPLRPRQLQKQPQQHQQPPASNNTTGASAARKKGSGTGLLGKLVGAQKRTNQHVRDASSKTPAANQRTQTIAPASAAAAGGDEATRGASMSMDSGGAPVATAVTATKTATQVMNEFRQLMESKMLDFDESPEEEVKISLSLPEYTTQLIDEEKPKITMEILKYMVYEAAEEVNEEWIAYKEPSEFMDEATIIVYKEGAAPPHVLEDVNKAELPEEVRGQQRAIQEERMKQMNQAEQRKANELLSQAHRMGNANGHGGDDDDPEPIEALNQNKRDRRSVADYERDKKRGKLS